MSLSLVLLLLPGILSKEVCITISKGEIEVSFGDLKVRDLRNESHLLCTENTSCYITCSNINGQDLFQTNESSVCHPVTVKKKKFSRSFKITSIGTCKVHTCVENEIMSLLKVASNSTHEENALVELTLMRFMCRNIFSSSIELSKLFIRVEKNVIHNIMAGLPYERGVTKHMNLKYMTLHMSYISNGSLHPSTSNILQISQDNSTVNVCLPLDALKAIPENYRLVNVVNYAWSGPFALKRENIQSRVVRIEILGDAHLSDLSTPVRMIFPVMYANMSNLHCHYYNEVEYQWKTDGCQTFRANDMVTCRCNHTTAFSVLLIAEPIGAVHWKILSYIGYIGCGLSAFCTALSLMVYVTHRKHREEPSLFIHMSLSGALFLLNMSFLMSEWGATVSLCWVCELIAALIHFSLLGSFTWMAVEGLHLYLMLIKVFNTEYRHYLLKLSLFGWGIPAMIVGVTLSLKDVKQIYGLKNLTMLESNQTNPICWLRDETYFYVTNVTYFALVFIFNTGILLIVANRIRRLAKTSSRSGMSCRSASTVIGLTGLLGTTWGLAFLGSGHVNYPILYLFCIFNSTQGVFIFVWILCIARKEKKTAMESKTVYSDFSRVPAQKST